MSEEEWEINETGFPYNPRFSTSTTALPTMRPLCNRKPSIPVFDYGRVYMPDEGYVCAHRAWPAKYEKILKERAAQQKQQMAQVQQQGGQAQEQEQGEDEE